MTEQETVEQVARYIQARDARAYGSVIDGVAHPTWDEAALGQDEYRKEAAGTAHARRSGSRSRHRGRHGVGSMLRMDSLGPVSNPDYWAAIVQIIPVLLLTMVIELREFSRTWPEVSAGVRRTHAYAEVLWRQAKGRRRRMLKRMIATSLGILRWYGVLLRLMFAVAAAVLAVTEVNGLGYLLDGQPRVVLFNEIDPGEGMSAVVLGMIVVVMLPVLLAFLRDLTRHVHAQRIGTDDD